MCHGFLSFASQGLVPAGGLTSIEKSIGTFIGLKKKRAEPRRSALQASMA
jgi:hypothetical protein